MDNESIGEIRRAVRRAAPPPATIHVLPTLPKTRPVFRCPYCRGSVYSLVSVENGWGADRVKVCSTCGSVPRGAPPDFARGLAWLPRRHYRDDG